jgi:hypothetical protein
VLPGFAAEPQHRCTLVDDEGRSRALREYGTKREPAEGAPRRRRSSGAGGWVTCRRKSSKGGMAPRRLTGAGGPGEASRAPRPARIHPYVELCPNAGRGRATRIRPSSAMPWSREALAAVASRGEIERCRCRCRHNWW